MIFDYKIFSGVDRAARHPVHSLCESGATHLFGVRQLFLPRKGSNAFDS